MSVSIVDNPYTYGNPISEPARFFGRRREIEQVISRLRNAEFESSSLVGERRIGKTSLLNYLAHPTVREAFGIDPQRYIFVYVDLQMLDGSAGPRQLWQRILRQIGRYCPDADIRQILEQGRSAETIDNFLLEDLFDSVEERGQKIVLLLDEFENVTENKNFGPDFFYGLRSLAIHRSLALVTSSRQELVELCHSEAIRSSPFFNIFANINLRLLEESDAAELVAHPLRGTPVRFDEHETRAILELAGSHPYFLQVACYFLFEAYARAVPDDRLVYVEREFRQQADGHLRDYWYASDDTEKIVLAALALLEHQGRAASRTFSAQHLYEVYARSEQTLRHLEKRGLVAAFKGDTFALFSPVLADWIIGEITLDRDEQGYEAWLASNQSSLAKLSTGVRGELAAMLPKVRENYRQLFIGWASDPRNVIAVVSLLRGSLGLG